jgi:hypothetical protein
MSDDGQYVYPVPPRTFLDGLKDYWPYLTALVVAAWGVFTWSADRVKESENRRAESERQAQVRVFEARKPFLDEQLGTYFRISRLAGQLAATSPSESNWAVAKNDFLEIYFGQLNSIADDAVWSEAGTIANAIGRLDAGRLKNEYQQKDLSDLKDGSLRMGREIKKSIEKQWVK